MLQQLTFEEVLQLKKLVKPISKLREHKVIFCNSGMINVRFKNKRHGSGMPF